MDRSEIMRRVRSVDTTPERLVRRIIYRLGGRFALHASDLPGRPDIVLRARGAVVFVHGCFWHGHDCARGARIPKANRAYWTGKVARNRLRDARTRRALQKQGWRTLVVWECQTRNAVRLEGRLRRFLSEHRQAL